MFDKVSKSIHGLKGSLPEMTKKVKIPVYVIYNSEDAEDYFFLIDFEEFVEKSTTGIFVRPSLEVWAGRDDFSRITFSRHFRQTFAAEFDQMRSEVLANSGGKKLGWLSLENFAGMVIGGVGGLLANVVLMIATRAGLNVLDNIKVPGFLKAKSKTAKMDEEIETTKKNVETALTNIEIRLHPELYQHAFNSGLMGPNANLERDAWPLPDNIRRHLGDGASSSHW